MGMGNDTSHYWVIFTSGCGKWIRGRAHFVEARSEEDAVHAALRDATESERVEGYVLGVLTSVWMKFSARPTSKFEVTFP